MIDLWGNGKPLYGENGTDYEEFMFQTEIEKIIDNKSNNISSKPFFLVYTSHLIHAPQQIPKEYLSLYDDDEIECSQLDTYVYPGFNNSNGNDKNYKCRSILESMVTLLDEIIGNITNKLKETNLWNNTLLILSTDNGGSIQLPCCSGNNYPLRGGKASPWEGGLRGAGTKISECLFTLC